MTTAVEDKPGVLNLFRSQDPMPDKAYDPSARIQRVVLGLFVLVLGSYLVARYTLFLSLLGINVEAIAGGVSASVFLPLLLIAVFFGIGAFAVLSPLPSRHFTGIEAQRKVAATLPILVAVALIGLGIGKLTYSEYIDETRDVVISNLVANHGLDIYIDNVGLEEAHIEDLKYHTWAQRNHPPGQYVLSTLLPGGSYGTVFFRFFALIPLLAFAFGAYVVARRFDFDIRIFVVMAVLLLGLTYMRNYTLVRYGNELIAFLAFSSMLIVLYLTLKNRIRLGASSIALIALLYTAGLFSKATVIIPMISLIGTLGLGSLLFRDMRLFKLAFVCGLTLVLSLALYTAVFWDTAMLAAQAERYEDTFSFLQTYVGAETNDHEGAIDAQLHFSRNYMFSIPFHYGLVIVFSLLYAGYCFVRRRVAFSREDFLIVFHILLAIIGITFGMVIRTQYTAPLMLPLVFLLARVLVKTLPTPLLMRFALIATSFALIEVLLYGAP